MTSRKNAQAWIRPRDRVELLSAHETRAEPFDQLAILRGQVAEKAVDRFDDDAPLRKPGDGAEGVQTRLHFDRYSNAQLRIICDPLALLCSCGRAAGPAATVIDVSHRITDTAKEGPG